MAAEPSHSHPIGLLVLENGIIMWRHWALDYYTAESSTEQHRINEIRADKKNRIYVRNLQNLVHPFNMRGVKGANSHPGGVYTRFVDFVKNSLSSTEQNSKYILRYCGMK